MKRGELYKCRNCAKKFKRSAIISFNEGDKYYMTCGKCYGELERAEIREAAAKRKVERDRERQIAKDVREATARERTAAGKVAATEKVLREADLQQRAREELAVRELCRRSMLDFVLRFKSNYKAGWVHHLVCHKLEKFLDDVANERSPRLMLFLPPRHGKSELVSDKFPSWALGRYPHFEIILASYAVTLATTFSQANRDRLKDPIYQQIFPNTRLDPDKQGSELWRTTRGGGFLAAGVEGPITGRGANIFIVDDPVKNYEEAESETVREGVKNWWRSTARTRLSPGGGVLIIQTRWHDDDLSGFLLHEYHEAKRAGIPEEELEEFEVVTLPAIAEEDEYLDKHWNLYRADEEKPPAVVQVRRTGDALHPQRYSAKYLAMTRRSMGERMFSALYQQNPVPESGDFFKAEDFRYYGIDAPDLGPRPVYFAWDLAISQRQSGDFTVGVAAMYDERGNLIVLDMVRGRWRAAEITDRMVDLIAKYPHNKAKLGVEQGQIWNAIQDDFWRKLHARGLSISRDESLRPMLDKRLRARPLQAWMQAGRVKFPSEQPWVEVMKRELLRFDAGVNDDTVDALAWLVRMIENEPLPDVERLRRMRDKFYMSRDSLIKSYEEKKPGTKRYMSA